MKYFIIFWGEVLAYCNQTVLSWRQMLIVNDCPDAAKDTKNHATSTTRATVQKYPDGVDKYLCPVQGSCPCSTFINDCGSPLPLHVVILKYF
ncbi:hypothetical protein CEXT_50171 [Caerostris extrusa]|uniref:Uncharacterized protein n=1 Tax=Caerostris extrusa TaxID=172846 RepID=A0AAV4SFH1_CAEEX|nr:hypothetical protein CEXT_50171 [Caerostris extrusa]